MTYPHDKAEPPDSEACALCMAQCRLFQGSVKRREEVGYQRQTGPGGTLKARQPGDRQAGESGDPITVLKEKITSGNFYLQGSDGP